MEDGVAKAIASSITHLKNSLKKKSLEEMLHRVWLAMSDVEYAAFMASINLRDKPRVSHKRTGKIENEDVVYEIIRSAILSLEKVKQNAEEGALESVYNEALRVHGDLLKILEYFEKKKKS